MENTRLGAGNWAQRPAKRHKISPFSFITAARAVGCIGRGSSPHTWGMNYAIIAIQNSGAEPCVRRACADGAQMRHFLQRLIMEVAEKRRSRHALLCQPVRRIL